MHGVVSSLTHSKRLIISMGVYRQDDLQLHAGDPVTRTSLAAAQPMHVILYVQSINSLIRIKEWGGRRQSSSRHTAWYSGDGAERGAAEYE